MSIELAPTAALASASRIPLSLKVAYTVFLAVLVPIYWVQYTPLNFLWFCDVALLLTFFALWTERPLLASMPAVGILLPQLFWVLDYAAGLVTGNSPVGLSAYMFQADIPLWARGLSLFHGWLPFLLVWLVWRLGYDRRAIWAQTLVCWGVLALSWLMVATPDGPAGNVNKIFGPDDAGPQTWMPHGLWLLVLFVANPLLIYLPTHAVLRRIAPQSGPTDSSDEEGAVLSRLSAAG